MAQDYKKRIRTLQCITILVIILFTVLSAFDCIHVRYTLHSQYAYDPVGNVREYTYNNQLVRVAIIGGIEILLVAASCFKLSISAAILELLLTAGIFCIGYIHEAFLSIGGMYDSKTIEITIFGWLVALLAVTNVILAVTMQLKKSAWMKKCENATASE